MTQEEFGLLDEGKLTIKDIALPEHDTRVETSIYECSQLEDGFDWNQYQRDCDIAEYWSMDD